MDQHLFRIPPTQAGAGRAAARGRRSGPGAARRRGRIPALLCGAGAATVLSPALLGQVVPAAKAPRENTPRVEAAANQTPLVQIVAPNAAGLSNNHFDQFNVGQQGLILNNARDAAMTQLAGQVAGNPALAGGSARIILNQVTGTHPSQLVGFTEVAGQRAEVIIANPNGITCNGGGFINTSRAVLTTGVPFLRANGSLDGFQVGATGAITVGPDGLKAANLDQVDLIARSLQVNGQIRTGGALNVVTGFNQVTYADLGVQVLPGLEGKPTVGLDVGLLGGMYANKIRLIGTEAGVGVNSQGTLAAQAGGFTCTQQGRIVLTGESTSRGSIALESKDAIANRGTVAARAGLTLRSASIANANGTLKAGPSLDLLCDGDLHNDRGVISADGQLNVNAARLDNAAGRIASGQDLVLAVGTLADPGTLSGGRDASVTLEGAYTHSDSKAISAGRDLTLRAAGTLTNACSLEVPGVLRVSGAKVGNEASGSISGRTTLVTASTSLDNKGRILGDDIALGAPAMTNHGNAMVAAQKSLNIGVARELHNLPEALLHCEGSLAIGGSLNAGNQAEGKADFLENVSAEIQGKNGDVTLGANRIVNRCGPRYTTSQDQVAQECGHVLIKFQGSSKKYPEWILTPTTGWGVGECWLLRERVVTDYTKYTFTRTTTRTTVRDHAPAKIIAGRNLTLLSNTTENEMSTIVAGNDLNSSLNNIKNIDAFGTTQVTDLGKETHTEIKPVVPGHAKHGYTRHWREAGVYAPTPVITKFPLGLVKCQSRDFKHEAKSVEPESKHVDYATVISREDLLEITKTAPLKIGGNQAAQAGANPAGGHAAGIPGPDDKDCRVQ